MKIAFENLYFATCIPMIVCILFLALVISRHNEAKLYKFFDVCGIYSYDIYLLSYYIQIPMGIVLYRILEMPYVLVVISMFIGGLIMSVAVSKIVIRKSNILSIIMIGNGKVI